MNSKLFLLQEEETESLLNSFSFPTFYLFFYSATLEYYYLILCNSETGQQFKGNLFVDLGTCLLMASFFMEFFLLNFQHLSSSLKCHSLVPQQNKTVNFFLSSICPMIAGWGVSQSHQHRSVLVWFPYFKSWIPFIFCQLLMAF